MFWFLLILLLHFPDDCSSVYPGAPPHALTMALEKVLTNNFKLEFKKFASWGNYSSSFRSPSTLEKVSQICLFHSFPHSCLKILTSCVWALMICLYTIWAYDSNRSCYGQEHDPSQKYEGYFDWTLLFTEHSLNSQDVSKAPFFLVCYGYRFLLSFPWMVLKSKFQPCRSLKRKRGPQPFLM